MIRPWVFYDRVFDFGPNGTYYDTFNVPINFPFVSAAYNKFYFYRLAVDGNTISNAYIRNTNTGETTFDQQQGVFVLPGAVNSANTNRRGIRPGLQKDEISYFRSTGSIFGSSWTTVDVGIFSYYYFQQAVAILKETTNSSIPTIINSGSIKNITINDILTFDISQTRGSELQKIIEIWVKDGTGTYVSAVQGVDFDITYGGIAPIASSLLGVRFIRSVEYRINFKVAGYNSFNNPYTPITDSRNLVYNNESQVVYYINSTTVSTTNTITFPKIDSNLDSTVILSSTPFSTYENNTFTVTGTLDLASGSWVELDNNTQISTTRTLTENEWLNELNSRCDVFLEIKDVQNIITVPTRTGLGPHTYSLPEGDFTVKFKTVKR